MKSKKYSEKLGMNTIKQVGELISVIGFETVRNKPPKTSQNKYSAILEVSNCRSWPESHQKQSKRCNLENRYFKKVP